jgi:hypothetical protein
MAIPVLHVGHDSPRRCGLWNHVAAMSIYALKPKFQALLRPVVHRLNALGVT